MKLNITILIILVSYFTYSQSTIKGKVVDKDGNPLYGVSVVLKSSKYFTDFTGEFSVKYSGEYPLGIIFNYIGFNSQTITLYKEGDGKNLLVQLLEPKRISINQVVKSASRQEEKKLETPVTIESYSSEQVKNGTASLFFNGLENIKETQFNSGSFLGASINTRGFASATNNRFLQLVDGIETAIPALNANLGNTMGLNKLDLESIEVLPGTSSALYGANAFNGMLFMNSISPFTKNGVSAYYTRGVTNQDLAGTKSYDDFGLRLGVKFSEKFAGKFNVTYFAGNEWLANNQTHDGLPGLSINRNQYFDAVNTYGDERVQLVPGLNQIVNRTGYKEIDLIDGKNKNIKLDGSLHFKPTQNFEIILEQKLSLTTSLFMDGGVKHALRDFVSGQSKMEISSKNFKSRSYVSFTDAGSSYNLTRAALNLGNAAKSDAAWFFDYYTAISKYDINEKTVNQAINAARKYADFNENSDGFDFGSKPLNQKRLLPGTVAFKNAFEKSINDSDVKNGSKIKDKSMFFNQDLNYNFKDLISFIEIQVGGSYRLYRLNSSGTIFTDNTTPISYDQYGIYTQAQKQFFEDRLKITSSVRYDKVHGLQANFSPRVSANFSLGEKKMHNLRASYQTGFRNPTPQDFFSGGDYGLVTLLGSAADNLSKYNEQIPLESNPTKKIPVSGNDVYNNSFTYASSLLFSQLSLSQIPVVAANAYKALVVEKVNPVTPEKIQSFEAGYRANLNGISIDVNGYYNKYNNFIYSKNVVKALYDKSMGDPDPISAGANALSTNDFKLFRVTTNSNTSFVSRGVGLGIDKNIGKLNVNLSYNYAELIDFDQTKDPNFNPQFNTPKHKAKFGLGHSKFLKYFGFNTNVRWNSEYDWISNFANGVIPETVVLDAQLNINILPINGNFKIGANNLFGKDYIQVIGAGLIGQQYYASFTYNL